MQTFLSTPKFDKQYIYKDPQNTFHKFTNAFTYYKMALLGSPSLDKKVICEECNN
ncbi:2483_t:CDS:1, partial [Racocetra fulgida]